MTVASGNTRVRSTRIPPQQHRDPFVSGNGAQVTNNHEHVTTSSNGKNRRELAQPKAFRARSIGTDRMSRPNTTNPSRRLVTRRRPRMPATFPIHRGFYNHAVFGIRSTQRAVRRNSGRSLSSIRLAALRPYNQDPTPKSDVALTHVGDMSWPTELSQSNVYVITIRSDRWNRMTSRLGDWAHHVKRFPGTNGHTINPRVWHQQKKLALKQMKRGRIGCYDSHVRVWKTIQQSGAPFALVLEDDADIRYSAQHASRIQGVLDTLYGRTGDSSHGTSHPWDVVLLGHYNDRHYTQGLGNGLTKATKWQPMHAYLISQSGVQKLLKNAWPIRHALDVYVGSEIKKGLIMYRLDPRLCGQLHFGHDTEAIK